MVHVPPPTPSKAYLDLQDAYNKQVADAQERYASEYEAVQQVHDAQRAANAKLWSLNRSNVPAIQPAPIERDRISDMGRRPSTPFWVIWCWLWLMLDLAALTYAVQSLVQLATAR